MLNQQILDYISQSRTIGQKDEQIKSALRQSGWQETDIEEGFKSFISTNQSKENNTLGQERLTEPLACREALRHEIAKVPGLVN